MYWNLMWLRINARNNWDKRQRQQLSAWDLVVESISRELIVSRIFAGHKDGASEPFILVFGDEVGGSQTRLRRACSKASADLTFGDCCLDSRNPQLPSGIRLVPQLVRRWCILCFWMISKPKYHVPHFLFRVCVRDCGASPTPNRDIGLITGLM